MLTVKIKQSRKEVGVVVVVVVEGSGVWFGVCWEGGIVNPE